MARIDNISKTFDPNEAEPRLYKGWMDKGYFKPDEAEGKKGDGRDGESQTKEDR